MKKLVTATAVALMLATPAAFAFGPGAARDGALEGPRFERMAQYLQLSEEQRSEVRAILDERRAKRQALREETKGKLSGVLTEEQQQRLEALRSRRPHHRRAESDGAAMPYAGRRFHGNPGWR